LARIVANAVARAFFNRGLSFAANDALTPSMGLMLCPVGWVVTGLWTLADLASPAYRVTVSCVVQIGYMRPKAIAGPSRTHARSATRSIPLRQSSARSVALR
jgi:uncharacterized protein YaaW (UPF0174 family)